jgi:hypothetical protein
MRRDDPYRAAALESAPSFINIVERIATAAASAVQTGVFHWEPKQPYSKCSGFERGVLQFPISTELFDLFWNSRSGYRAQFWISAKNGMLAETLLVSRINSMLPQEVQELGLFDPNGSKCWIAEDDGLEKQKLLQQLLKTRVELDVPRWPEPVAQALRPSGKIGWIEMKSPFRCGDRTLPPLLDERAETI